MNNVTLLIKSGGNWILSWKSLKTNLLFQRNNLWPLRSWPERILIKLNSRASAVEMVVTLEESNM